MVPFAALILLVGCVTIAYALLQIAQVLEASATGIAGVHAAIVEHAKAINGIENAIGFVGTVIDGANEEDEDEEPCDECKAAEAEAAEEQRKRRAHGEWN